jgi:hypothetical protein
MFYRHSKLTSLITEIRNANLQIWPDLKYRLKYHQIPDSNLFKLNFQSYLPFLIFLLGGAIFVFGFFFEIQFLGKFFQTSL